MRIIFILLFLLCFQSIKIFADATPKFNDRPVLDFWNNGESLQQIDSILIISVLESDTTKIDSLWLTKWRRHVSQNVVKQRNGEIIIDSRTRIKSFKIQLVFNNKKYASNWIDYIGSRSYFRFYLNPDGDIKENHTLFFAKWSDYFKSLGITILLEFLISFSFFIQIRKNISISLLSLFIANIITHPILWYIDSHININIFILELGVFVTESLILIIFLRKLLKIKSILKLTLFSNWISWWFGAIIYWIIV